MDKIQTTDKCECEQDNKRIAILMASGFELPLSLIAITLSRHSFLILDPMETIDTLMKKIHLSRITCILYDYKSLNVMEKIATCNPNIHSIFIETYFDEWENGDNAVLELLNKPRPQQSDLHRESFVVFTSGTTGDPKLISILEKSLSNHLKWDVWHCLKLQRCIQLSHTQFDMFIAEIFGLFVFRSTIYLINSMYRLDFRYIWLRYYDITVIHTTPTLLSFFLGQKCSSGESVMEWNAHSLASLKHVLSMGEKLTSDLCALFFRRFPPGKSEVCLHNWGGPSECCIAYAHCITNQLKCADFIPMGSVIHNSDVIVVNKHSHKIVPIGIPGEILVSGLCFPFCDNQKDDTIVKHGKCWCVTGDVGFIDNKHQLTLLFRSDSQVKIASQRIELLGIQTLILNLQLPGLVDVIVDIVANKTGPELVCFPIISNQKYKTFNYQKELLLRLHKYYLPRVVKAFCGDEVPLLLSGKKNLKDLKNLAIKESVVLPTATVEVPCDVLLLLQRCLHAIIPHAATTSSWLQLTLDSLGMSSLHKAQLYQMLNDEGFNIIMESILMSHSIYSLANIIAKNDPEKFHPDAENSDIYNGHCSLIGIIAMGVNLPQVSTCDEFWDVVMSGKEAISHSLPALTSFKPLVGKYIGSRGLVSNVYEFDNSLFGFTKDKADMMDPQQRLLLQSVYSTLEKTGLDPIKIANDIKIGCFAAVHFPNYMLDCILSDPDKRDELVWENLRDNAALIIGRYFDFRGPCVTLTNNCSTVAVAMHYARLSILNDDCDMAVVVGASIYGQATGYVTHDDDIYSKDGHCCPFSESASGTVMSDGVTVIILKRIDEMSDGDSIICLVKGTSVGSDGAFSSSNCLVPSVQGQTDNLKNLLTTSCVHADSVELIEAHGSGTKVGDLIEIESLSAVFGKDATKMKVIGSVKGNFGHIGVAAAGPAIVKASLSIKEKLFPPSINCTNPLPLLTKGGCFKLLSVSEPWFSASGPRRALVHSIGAMGTNAAIILEERHCTGIDSDHELCKDEKNYLPCCISAQSLKSLKEYLKLLIGYLHDNVQLKLCDVLYFTCSR